MVERPARPAMHSRIVQARTYRRRPRTDISATLWTHSATVLRRTVHWLPTLGEPGLPDTLRGKWLQPKDTLEDYGFHIIPLPPGYKGGLKVKGENVRWAIVGIDERGQTVYDAQRSRRPLKSKFLVVMSAPATHRKLSMHFDGDGQAKQEQPRLYPYKFHL